MFEAFVLKVLVSSPGDAAEEVGAVKEALQGWNGDRSEAARVILLPRHWRSDAVPRVGSGSGQGVINEQLVDDADIVIALFDSRLGQATDAAVSGTAEEIQRASEAGKHVHVWFSNEPVSRDVDVKQFVALRKFRQSLESQGLLGQYNSLSDLAYKVRSAIEDDIRRMGLDTPTARSDSTAHARPRARRRGDYLVVENRSNSVKAEQFRFEYTGVWPASWGDMSGEDPVAMHYDGDPVDVLPDSGNALVHDGIWAKSTSTKANNALAGERPGLRRNPDYFTLSACRAPGTREIMTEDSTPKRRLPEDRQFRAVVIVCCVAMSLFMTAFVVITVAAGVSHTGLLTSDWYGAWGTWAGGAATAAAFLIAAFSLRVSSAHAHADRADAAAIRQNNDMAQARLLVIYKVEMPDGVSSLATFRIENRSQEQFFDVSVPFVDSPNGPGGQIERRTPDLVESENRLHEFVPTAELLTAYRSHNEHEAWFTLVTMHTSDWRGIKFAVEYTDSGGRRWRQQLGGKIEPIFTSDAIPVREADRFQPRQQIRRTPPIELRRRGGRFAKDLPPLERDGEYLEVLEVSTVVEWRPIELSQEPVVTPGDEPGQIEVQVSFFPAGPPFWKDHFREKLDEYGFRFTRGSSGGRGETQALYFPEERAERAGDLLRDAVAYANSRFAENELAAAQRALEKMRERGR